MISGETAGGADPGRGRLTRPAARRDVQRANVLSRRTVGCGAEARIPGRDAPWASAVKKRVMKSFKFACQSIFLGADAAPANVQAPGVRAAPIAQSVLTRG